MNGVYDAPDHPKLLRDQASARQVDHVTRVVCDDPSLVVEHSGIYCHSPASLRARDNWFWRHESQLAAFLHDPRIAQVFTFQTGKLVDPLSTFKAKPGGPCPLPRGNPWPTCGFCQTPLVMVGVLDFRDSGQSLVPKGSLVVHGCPSCGFCGNEETWAVNWLIAGEPYDLHGDPSLDVEVGVRCLVTDYPTPPFDARFEMLEKAIGEQTLYANFTVGAEKVGGHACWIQGDDEFKDTDYAFIGQMTGDDESLNLWDSPIVYLMYSPTTGKTIASLQSF